MAKSASDAHRLQLNKTAVNSPCPMWVGPIRLREQSKEVNSDMKGQIASHIKGRNLCLTMAKYKCAVFLKRCFGTDLVKSTTVIKFFSKSNGLSQTILTKWMVGSRVDAFLKDKWKYHWAKPHLHHVRAAIISPAYVGRGATLERTQK